MSQSHDSSTSLPQWVQEVKMILRFELVENHLKFRALIVFVKAFLFRSDIPTPPLGYFFFLYAR